MTWTNWAQRQLADIRDAQLWREAIAFDGDGPRGITREQQVVSFAANDYLGLSGHPEVREAAVRAIEKFGAGSMASRLVVGTRSLHDRLEQSLAQWHGTERALVFPTGYAANLAARSVLGAEDVTIFSDELNHASIVDGCRLAKAEVQIYRHCDMEHLGSLMRSVPGRKLVVSDVVFSMDGDVAPLMELAALCRRHDALLLLDEAHAVLEPVRDLDCEILRVGTLSKTLGALGGWIAGTRAMVDLLVNRARTFIFTTALSPADTAAALAALQILVSSEGERLRADLVTRIAMLRPSHRTPILPIVFGDERSALLASQSLLEQGFLIPAIRPPSVAKGTSRLRVALSAAHRLDEIRRLQVALAHLPCPVPPT